MRTLIDNYMRNFTFILQSLSLCQSRSNCKANWQREIETIHSDCNRYCKGIDEKKKTMWQKTIILALCKWTFTFDDPMLYFAKSPHKRVRIWYVLQNQWMHTSIRYGNFREQLFNESNIGYFSRIRWHVLCASIGPLDFTYTIWTGP